MPEITQPKRTQQMVKPRALEAPGITTVQPVGFPFPTPNLDFRLSHREARAKAMLTPTSSQKPKEPMMMGIRGGGVGEEVCCGW